MFSITRLVVDRDPDWLINSVSQAVAQLPQLTNLTFRASYHGALPPLELFFNLSKLSLEGGWKNNRSSFISQMATVISNNPRLRCLNITNLDYAQLPTLSELFAKLSEKNPLCIEQLHTSGIDATVYEVTLPHLAHLTTFRFYVDFNPSIAQSVWTGLRINNVKLSNITVGEITRETMLYLSSFSGLKSLAVYSVSEEDLENMMFTEVLPRHVNSLEVLKLEDWVKLPLILSFVFLANSW
jgi:hypothetical protein